MTLNSCKEQKRKKLFGRDDISAYIMLLPFFVFFSFFILMPLAFNFVNSFTNSDLSRTGAFIGLKNYAGLLKDEDFLRSLANTAVYALCSVIPLTVLGFAAAVAVNGRSVTVKAATTLFMFPYITSMVAVSMIWLLLYEPSDGILNKIFALAGIKPLLWLFDENLALFALILMNIWKNMGYVMIVYLAGLQSIPPPLYESATVDGASDFDKLFKITIPQLSNITFFILVTLCVEAFKTFDQVRIMTGGGPVNSTTTIVHQIYIRAFSEFKMGYASSMSIVLLDLTFFTTLLNMKLGSGKERL